MDNLGREKLAWSQELWDRIDKIVHNETQQIKVAAKFIPLYGPLADAMTVHADTINLQTMTVDEGLVKPLIEIWVELVLTKEQVENEDQLSTTVTLATRAANLLSQGEDILIFQGDNGLGNDLFKTVHHRGGPAGEGLLQFPPEDQRIDVDSIDTGTQPKRYGENTFKAVAQGYALLQKKGHYGPYALVLATEIYADTYAPLANTLIMPADRIKPLVTAGFYGTGTVPASTGLLTSLGGNTVDLVIGVDIITALTQVDSEGLYHFRVNERFALRVKDPTALVLLNFK
jgi:uncharacterized linocin/CFP29 family protein